MKVDENDPHSLSWQGIGGRHCCLDIPQNAMEHINDDVSYLESNDDFDDLGCFTSIEPATTADWFRHTDPSRGFIPVAPEDGHDPEWFQDLSVPTPSEMTASGKWRIPQPHCGIMEATITSFRQAVEAIAEHTKYDLFIFCPTIFEVEELQQEFSSLRELLIAATQAKRSVLDMWGHLAWWISSVPGWDEGIGGNMVEQILGWNLLSRRKRGFLVSLTRDWKELNFGHLIRLGVPLYYVWGIFEDADPRYLRLSPNLMSGYRNACREADVRSLWGDEMGRLRSVFATCAKYDAFLEARIAPNSRPSKSAPSWTATTGVIRYEVKV
ncbi:hypothetical protein C8R46DRAFT_1050820 [Mycena filopes]|nr:hypothetical protein C8R46DRAFT_1050820 [Mycena filopes]